MSGWHRRDIADILQALGTDRERGLSAAAAADRLRAAGPNELPGGPLLSPWRILLSQFSSSMVVVLLCAAAVSALLRDPADAVAIVAIVVLNALLGFTQEYRAERAVAALRRLAAPEVRVRRD
ncbi:MAG TPA: cation-transporting P-type ATPase, partial [Candidatus Deferrimicrobiaceae bacterium]